MSESPSKKHKKHKKHKHKRKHGEGHEGDTEDHGMGDMGDEDVDVVSTGLPQPTQPSIKLKIKLGGQPLASGTNKKKKEHHGSSTPQKKAPVSPSNEGGVTPSKEGGIMPYADKEGRITIISKEEGIMPYKEGQITICKEEGIMPYKEGRVTICKEEGVSPSNDGGVTPSKELDIVWEEDKVKGEDVFLTKKKGDDTSDEEKEWLDALEAGTLDDSGAVKKNMDESLLTSRQRALIHGKPEEILLQLPSGYKQPEFTEEQLQRRQQRAKKRRDLAFEKQEKEKKQTLDRLLKKQESKMKRGKSKFSKRSQAPGYRYSSNASGDYVCVPQGFQFPFSRQQAKMPPKPVLCGVDDCCNQKKYNCSKTGIPLCSLECYKQNLSKYDNTSLEVVM